MGLTCSFSRVGALLLAAAALVVGRAHAVQSWAGMVDVTSDYIVRGVSPSDDRPALQFDVHCLDSAGLFAGVFASDTVFQSHRALYAELDPYAGYAWQVDEEWRAKVVIDAYLYPRNPTGHRYDYEEVAFVADYHDWLSLKTTYSPDAPRASLFFQGHIPLAGIAKVHAASADVAAQRPLYGQLSALGGIGVFHLEGIAALNYLYWDIGARFDRSPVALNFFYVGTSNAAKTLFYNGSGGGRWVGTVIWSF
jgi:uncharacterized protein (TIGR02001 family)